MNFQILKIKIFFLKKNFFVWRFQVFLWPWMRPRCSKTVSRVVFRWFSKFPTTKKIFRKFSKFWPYMDMEWKITLSSSKTWFWQKFLLSTNQNLCLVGVKTHSTPPKLFYPKSLNVLQCFTYPECLCTTCGSIEKWLWKIV